MKIDNLRLSDRVRTSSRDARVLRDRASPDNKIFISSRFGNIFTK
ncbi:MULTISPECIES: hypothetical protein [Cyanophyceae]|nr:MULTISPECIES: hypothetical protein [unclassified Trichocoleus]